MNKTLAVSAPHNGEVIETLTESTAGEVDRWLAEAHALYRDRKRWIADSTRMTILRRAAELLSKRAEDFAQRAAREGGKPLVDSRVEVQRAIEGLELCEEALRNQCGTQVPMNNPSSAGRYAFTFLEPIGPVVAVSAFNHPLNLIVHQVAPAIAAGCPAIVKPAPDTPLSCLALIDLLREAGLPEEWCRVVITSDNDVASQLVVDPRVAFFSFIGSARVGWMLRSKLAPGTRCALEHGGVAPVVVMEDADLADVVPRLAKGAFYHAGQVCVSVQRVFVARAILEDFCKLFVAEAKNLVVGDPLDDATTVGPLIRPGEVDRIESWVDEAKTAGSEILVGGGRIGPRHFQPTVILNPAREARVSQQEIFGPVACVIPFDDVESAIEQANSLPYAFQAAVCTRDIDRAFDLSRALDASAVMVNDHTAFRVDWMPFAGLRQSGLGVGGIHHTMRDMQYEKMVVVRRRDSQSKGLR